MRDTGKKQIRCGRVLIGGGAPVSVQSMTNVDSRDEAALLRQIAALEAAGCEIVRIAVPDMEAAETLGRVRKQTELPLVADIHFDHRLAIAAIEKGADKIRINPGNIGSREKVRQVVEAAKEYGIPIRVGVNSGSLEKDILEKNGGVTAEGLAESALRSLALIEDMGFDDLAVMGCAVNGPGEAREADYGIAGGQGKGVIFAKGQLLMTVPEEELVDRLMKVIEEHERII